jgi:hypothetical protein
MLIELGQVGLTANAILLKGYVPLDAAPASRAAPAHLCLSLPGWLRTLKMMLKTVLSSGVIETKVKVSLKGYIAAACAKINYSTLSATSDTFN